MKLVIVSGGGELEGKVVRASESYGFVEYYKKASDETKIRLLKESSLFVFPTSKEGFPLVPIEAMACNTPFLGYDIPEMREMREITSGGVLVPYGDVNALAEKICAFIGNESKLKRLGNAGRSNVEKRLNWENVARREETIFKELIKTRF